MHIKGRPDDLLLNRVALPTSADEGLSDTTIGSLHPIQKAFEEYCFSRLPEICSSNLEKHVSSCEPCRRELNSHKISKRVLQAAVLQWKAAAAAQNGTRAGGTMLHARASQLNAVQASRNSVPDRVTASDIKAARQKLPISSAVVSRCIAALNRTDVELSEIECIVSQDPGLAAHLVKAANTALMNSGRPIRSVGEAIMYIGLESAKLHVLALSIKAAFGSPQLRVVWNHSITVAKLARTLAEISRSVAAEQASLAGLVHDIGHLVLAGLGPGYASISGELRKQELTPVQAEWKICGASHALIGADLLAEWFFPADTVEAVRHHHSPLLSGHPLTSILFVAECRSGAEEDAVDPIEHSLAVRDLCLSDSQMHLLAGHHASDLDILSFAA